MATSVFDLTNELQENSEAKPTQYENADTKQQLEQGQLNAILQK